jgi:hypothetical protein
MAYLVLCWMLLFSIATLFSAGCNSESNRAQAEGPVSPASSTYLQAQEDAIRELLAQ